MQQYFSTAAGFDLKPLFDLYVRSTDKLEVHVTGKANNKYLVQLQNIAVPLPLDIVTDNVTQRVVVNSKGITIQSKTLPVIDPDMYYFKKVMIE